nr:hypothetical protein Iba_chr09dCG12580 [Ipomoea batatas]
MQKGAHLLHYHFAVIAATSASETSGCHRSSSRYHRSSTIANELRPKPLSRLATAGTPHCPAAPRTVEHRDKICGNKKFDDGKALALGANMVGMGFVKPWQWVIGKDSGDTMGCVQRLVMAILGLMDFAFLAQYVDDSHGFCIMK